MLACAFLLRIRASLTVIWISHVLKRASARNWPDVLKGLQYRFLGHVLGIRLIPQNRKGRGVHAPFVGPDQFVEKIVLAIPDAPNQHSFVELFGWTFQRSHFFRHRSSPQH